ASGAASSAPANYTIAYQPGTLTIDPAALTVTALNQSSTYGQTPSLDGSAYSVSGLVNGDTISGVTLATVATNKSGAGTYAITASGAASSAPANYTIAYQPGTLTIDPAALTVTALNQTSTYGQAPTLGTSAYSTSGLVNGDTVSGVTLATAATGRSAVGNYDITASAAQGSGLANYTVTYQPGTLTIDPAALTVTALNQASTYGQAPSLDGSAYSVSGLVNGDTISGVTLATLATNKSGAGTYAITASGAAGSAPANYTIAYQPGTLTIDPAALTVTALNQTGTYGQTPNLGTSAYSTTGLVNGDSISGVTLATAATTQSEAGTYAIAISGAQGSGLGNYTVSYQAGVYTIQPAPHQVDPTAGVSPIFWPVMAMGSSVGVAQAQSVQAPTTPMIVPVADATADAANGNRTHDTLLLTRPRVSVSADPTLGNGGAQGYRIVLPSSSVSNQLEKTL
ncbi:hypothetical protein C7453_1232, partial [Gluconacetobacter liquefaciens]